MENNYKKYKLGVGLKAIDDYNIYNFFKYSDTKSRLKFSAFCNEDYYVINECGAYGRDHEILIKEIKDYIGDYESRGIILGSLGKDLEVIAQNESLCNTEIDVIIDILRELQSYYNDYRIDKRIYFTGIPFENLKIDRLSTCEDIDNIINEIQSLKKNRNK